MDLPELSWSAAEAFRSNFSATGSQQGHFQRCWSQQTCGGCLRSDECSWCPFTWSCVPNSYKIPLLAPAYDEQVCPYGAERWEIRTQPFGCHVSTITSLTAIVSFASALVAVLLVFAVVAATVYLRRSIKDKRGWRRRWRNILRRGNAPERDPLLSPRPDGEVARQGS